MKPIPPFVITSFTNPSGDVVFRVSGWLDGKRIRKNFSTRVEADAERQVLEVQRAQGETGIRTAITRLTDDQIGEAETLFARAQGMPRPLAFYLDFAFANYREPQTRKLLSDAVVLYTAAKDHEFKQDQISSPQLERIKRDLKRLEKHFPNVTVREPRKITIQPNLSAWLQAYPLDEFPIVPENFQHVRAKIAKDFGLSHDIMRHTFISMFVAKFRSLGEAALQAGNSEAIIRKHYLDLKSQTEAERFFGIMPEKRIVQPQAALQAAS